MQHTAAPCNKLRHTATLRCKISPTSSSREGALQRIATHCNTLQPWGVPYRRQRRPARAHYSTAQHTATNSITQQHTATHCTTLQHWSVPYRRQRQPARAHSSTTQHTATHSNTQQHTATHCTTLHHTATLKCTMSPTTTFRQGTIWKAEASSSKTHTGRAFSSASDLCRP